MRSIFDHKQYDAAFLDSGYFRKPTVIQKEIDGIEWEIEPIVNIYSEKYYNREINLKLLDGEVDTENYEYTCVVGSKYGGYYIKYSDGKAYMTKLRHGSRHVESIEMSFKELCKMIKTKGYENYF